MNTVRGTPKHAGHTLAGTLGHIRLSLTMMANKKNKSTSGTITAIAMIN